MTLDPIPFRGTGNADGPQAGCRVLFIAPAAVAGSLQYTHNLANALANRGHDVLLATAINFEMGPYLRRYRAIEVFDRFTPHVRRLAAFLREARRFRPDVVHFQGAQHPEFYFIMWMFLKALTRAKFAWNPQEVISSNPHSWHDFVFRLTYRRIDHVFVNAQQNRQFIVEHFKVPADSVTVLPLPDLIAFARDDLTPVAPSVPPGRRVILCFGLIEPRKGILTLIDAFAKVRARVQDAYLLIVGKPLCDVAPYQARIDDLGLGDESRIDPRYVSFEEMAGLFSRADVVALPYHTGANSGVLATAFGFGTPAVATTVGGHAEAMNGESRGLLVPPRDADALADALVRILDDPALHARLGANAAAEAARASWAAVGAETEAVYHQMLSQRPDGPRAKGKPKAGASGTGAPATGRAGGTPPAARVLFVVPTRVGGTIQYTHNLANALADQGDDVMMAVSVGFEMEAFPRRYRAVEVFDRARIHVRRTLAFLAAAHRFRPHVVHFQGAQRPEFYLILWLLLRVLTPAQFVWTPQDVLSNTPRARHKIAYRMVYARMAHVFLNARQNERVITELFRVERSRITILPIPDLVAFIRRDLVPAMPDVPPDRRLLLCFGLIEPRKGIDTLIRAYARVRDRVPDTFLMVMGKPLFDIAPLQALVEDLGLGQHARIVGRYAAFEEMAGLFERAHMVILPYHEGWNSGVLAAAFGYGKPVIATTIGGFDEAVASEDNGLLVPPRDPEALAAGIVRLMEEPGLHARLSDGAAREAARISWDSVAETTRRVYDRLMRA